MAIPENALEVVMDNLEVGGEVPLGPEPGRAVEAEVDILVLLAAVQRQVPARISSVAQPELELYFFNFTILLLLGPDQHS